jgi:uncharacterized membrane protein YphA (DoxX/SURF4 family)
MKQLNRNELTRILITILRMAIGWHFLYEGFSKIMVGNWTAYSYLANTSGFFSGFYQSLASSPALLKIVDLANMYGLTLIGLALFTGLAIRYAAAAGIMLLTLYYFAYPPMGISVFRPGEGQLFIIDKNVIEALTLGYIIFSRVRGYGMDTLRAILLSRKNAKPVVDQTVSPESGVNTRREVLKNLATVPVLGILGAGAIRMHQNFGVDVMSGATIQLKSAALGELKGTLPKGKIGQHEISRLVMGGNLIGGWAHARDLLYAPSLFKAYNTEKKVYETLMLAENAGINSINIGFPSFPLMVKYKKMTGSTLKIISQVAPNMEKGDIYEQINQAIDYGVDILQVQGNWCDWLVRDKNLDVIVKMLDRIRSQGYTAGLGAHTIDSFIVCEENGIIPDYYMKTMHHDNYWSAHPRENRVAFEVDGKKHLDHNMFHDNCFCPFPDRTVEFVNKAQVPVMGFKVLAAGAITPEDGFRWAFENGADFICVGMFDFQLINDVNVTIDVLNNLPGRLRKWYA